MIIVKGKNCDPESPQSKPQVQQLSLIILGPSPRSVRVPGIQSTQWALASSCKENLRTRMETMRSAVVWKISSASPLEVTSWTAIIHPRVPWSTRQHFWEIHSLKHLQVGNQGELGRREGRRVERGAADIVQSSLRLSGEQRNQAASTVFFSPKHSCLSD